jgi:hypothetical protein
MFPDMNRQVGGVTASDGVGFRVHATAAQGSPVDLFISSGIMPPIALGGVNGELALDITSPAFGEIFSSLPALPLAVTGPTGTPPGLASRHDDLPRPTSARSPATLSSSVSAPCRSKP